MTATLEWVDKIYIGNHEVTEVYLWYTKIRPDDMPSDFKVYLPLQDDFADHWADNIPTNAYSVWLTTLDWVKCAWFGDETIGSFISMNIWNRCVGNPDFTISLWAYLLWHWEDTLVFFWDINWTASAWLWIDDPSFDLCVGWWDNDRDTGFMPQLNQWYHIVLTHNNGTAKVYVDWNLIYTGSVNYNITQDWTTIGRALWNRWYVDWYMNDVIIDNKTWTASQVSAYYNSTVWEH